MPQTPPTDDPGDHPATAGHLAQPAPSPNSAPARIPSPAPVPITVWHVQAPPPGAVMAGQLAHRLRANYSPPDAPTLDLTGTAPRRKAHAEDTTALVITRWPAPGRALSDHIADAATHLRPAGCLAVVVPNAQIPDHLGQIVLAARAAGLTYLQHVIAAHHLAPRPQLAPPGHRHRGRTTRRERSLRVHTDVLLFRRPPQVDADA